MHIRKKWNRRDFIRAAGLSGIAGALLPFIPNLSSLGNAQTGGLKRLLLLTTGNGTVLDNWRSNGPGTPFNHNEALPELKGPILAPLNKYRENLLLLDGIDLTSVADLLYPPGGSYRGSQGVSHGHSGHSVLWTGRPGKKTQNEGRSYPQGPSLDQIFNDVKGENRKSIQSGIWKTKFLTTQQLGIYDSQGTPLTGEHDPQAIFDRIFTGGNTNNNEDPYRKARDKSGVNLLRNEIRRIRKQLPSDDKLLLDRHIDGLNQLETGFKDIGGICNLSGARPTPYDIDSLQKSFDDHTTLIASAFGCDQVRASSFVMAPENQWGAGGPLASLIPGFNRSIHGASHHVYDDMNALTLMTGYQNFMAQQFTNILDKLAAENVLDETLVVWGMGMGSGNHTNRNTPFVLFQGNNGEMKTNRYIQYGNFSVNTGFAPHGGETNNNLLVSILHALGMPEVKNVGPTEIQNGVGTSVLCNPDGTGLDDSLFGGAA